LIREVNPFGGWVGVDIKHANVKDENVERLTCPQYVWLNINENLGSVNCNFLLNTGQVL
jgi:hypothetical protein